MSCFECIHGPRPCNRWTVEGHTLLCQESKPIHCEPASIPDPDMKKLEEEVNKEIDSLYNN